MTHYAGDLGLAIQLELNPKVRGVETTVTWWLLTGNWHPWWPQFIVSVVRLEDVEGFPPAKLHFEGATHELQVFALDPGVPPRSFSPDALSEHGLSVTNGYLQPIDVIHQFTATDEEMTLLAELCARACIDGVLNPSTDDARERLRSEWLGACVKTLAHMRGEEHAP